MKIVGTQFQVDIVVVHGEEGPMLERLDAFLKEITDNDLCLHAVMKQVEIEAEVDLHREPGNA